MDRGAWRAAVTGSQRVQQDWVSTHANYSPRGSSAHGILQARVLEWVAISCSRGSSPPSDRTSSSCLADSSPLSHQGSPPLTYNTFITFLLTWGLSLGYSFTDLFLDSRAIFWKDFTCKSLLIFGKSSPSTSFSSFSIFLSYNIKDLKHIPVIISSSENNIWLKTKSLKILHIFEKQKEESLWH